MPSVDVGERCMRERCEVKANGRVLMVLLLMEAVKVMPMECVNRDTLRRCERTALREQ